VEVGPRAERLPRAIPATTNGAVIVRTTRTRLSTVVAAAALALTGMVMVAPGVAEAVTCPTVNPVTGTVTPLPTAGVNWAGCDLHSANIEGANLAFAILTGADLSSVRAADIDMTGANLTAATLVGAHMERAIATNASLWSADLTGANLAGANLSGAYLYGTNFQDASLSDVNFTGADLTYALFSSADMSGANLTNTDLTDAYLSGVDLRNAFGCGIVGTPATLNLEFSIIGGCLTYTRSYRMSAFRNPVNNPPVVNVATAGKTVAFRFTVTDEYGSPVTNVTTVTPTVKVRTCSTTARRDPIEWYSKGGLPLQNLGGGSYRYNFKTRLAWVGTCRSLSIDVGDGVQYPARFQFLP